MKPFRFQQFTVQQSKEVFRVGTDGVLLGSLCWCAEAGRILEVGSGTGLISLMVAQRCSEAKILALDINPAAVQLTQKNFASSPFSKRLVAEEHDFKFFEPTQKFDLIVSNPPYFEENTSLKDTVARQTVELNFRELLASAVKMISKEGILSLIVPSESSSEIIALAKKIGVELCRKVNIYGIEGGSLRRNILEFSFTPKNLVEENFIIEKSPRKYSDQYLELTREFHIFGK